MHSHLQPIHQILMRNLHVRYQFLRPFKVI